MTKTQIGVRPDWFSGLWTEAQQLAKVDQSFLESALGLGKLIDEGNIVEARRIYVESLYPALIYRKLYTYVPGERDSTQLEAMIASGDYPQDLCKEVERALTVSAFSLDRERGR